MFTFWNLGNLSYSVGQFANTWSQNSSAINKNNTDGKENFCGKLT